MRFAIRASLIGWSTLLLSAATLWGQGAASSRPLGTAPRILRAARLESAPLRLDARFEHPVWQGADVATDFVQLQPHAGEPATERTEVRVAFDEGALYVAMRMHDSAPDSIAAQMGRRDASGIYSDWVHVIIDSYHDRRTAFRFSVNPRGVKKDVLHFNDTEEDLSWDAVWDVAVQTDSAGWSALFRIPLSQLRFSTRSRGINRSEAEVDEGVGEGMVWGVNFGRVIARKGEHSYWSPVRPEASGFVSQAGLLHHIPVLAAPRRLELLPYSLARATRAPGEIGDPFHRPTALFGAAGADLKLGLSSNMTLTASLNPDFGQVEADPSEVNLSAFETFYGEKRPFFLEGADIFRFRLNFGDGDGENEQLFYSRRIGRAPQGSLPDNADFADRPDGTTILGAAKLSGKSTSGWSVGVLNALTARERAQVAYEEGGRGDVVVEPLTNYAVARVMKDVRGGESTFGAIVTATNRDLAGTGLDFLRSAAYSGGMNLRHRFRDGNYEFTGYLLGSHIQGSTEAITRVQRAAGHYFQRPDAEHLTYDTTRTALSGAAAALNLGKFGGGRWRWAVGASTRSPGLELNDLGYQQGADVHSQFTWVGYRSFQPRGIFRNWGINLNQRAEWSWGGERTGTGGNVNGNAQFTNYWSAYAGINRNLSALSTTALRGGAAIVRPARLNYWFGIGSDSRKPIQVSVDANGQREDGTGGSSFWVGPSLRLRPSSRLDLSLSPGLSWNDPAWQYVTRKGSDAGDHYVFGHLEQRTVSLTTRLDYTFTPALSLQLYAAPFVSAGRYSRFMEVIDPRAERFADRFFHLGAGQITTTVDSDGERTYHVDRSGSGASAYSFSDPDFNVRELRSNLVLRWEYRPGSTLFLVWSQGRSDSTHEGAFDLGRDGRRLFQAPGTNVLMVKVNYWLNL